MDNDRKMLIEKLRIFHRQLSSPAETADSVSGVELIDFDNLRKILSETAAELEAARSREQDHIAIRQWFANRIQALRRGRKAVVREPAKDLSDPAGESIRLIDLARMLDEESARMRRTLSGNSRVSVGGFYKSAEDFRSFKS